MQEIRGPLPGYPGRIGPAANHADQAEIGAGDDGGLAGLRRREGSVLHQQ
jgi:hypothetical protein